MFYVTLFAVTDWAAWVIGGAGIIGGLLTAYARESKSIAVLEARLEDALKRIDSHSQSFHKTNGVLANVDARLRLAEYKLGLQSP